MPTYNYILLDVFTDRAFGGNQLAVFPDARGLDSATMQSIAAELNLAETTFVFPPADPANDYNVRIFTASIEMPMAGHPTIGTAFVLARRSDEQRPVLRFEEKVGLIPVSVTYESGVPTFAQMQQPLPTFGPQFNNRDEIAELLSLTPNDIDANLPIEVVSCGVPYLIIPLTSLNAVKTMRYSADVWARSFAEHTNAAVYVFAPEAETPEAAVHGRMFSTDSNGLEDSATGSANGPLGCYLVRHAVFGTAPTLQIVSEQGFEMQRPSFLHIEVAHEGDAITSVRVGGQSVFMGEGSFTLQVPDTDA